MTYAVVVPHPSRILSHALYGEWAVPEYEYAYLPLGCILRMLGTPEAEAVPIDEIAAKPGDYHDGDDFSGPRYEAADPRYPGLIIRGMPNPLHLPYRMVDGRRRMHKIRMAGGTTGMFHVYEYDKVKPFIVEVRIDPDAGAGAGQGGGLLSVQYAAADADATATATDQGTP